MNYRFWCEIGNGNEWYDRKVKRRVVLRALDGGGGGGGRNDHKPTTAILSSYHPIIFCPLHRSSSDTSDTYLYPSYCTLGRGSL